MQSWDVNSGTLGLLPYEVLALVMECLQTTDLYNCRFVSSKLNQLANDAFHQRFIQQFGPSVAALMYQLCTTHKSSQQLAKLEATQASFQHLSTPSWIFITKFYCLDWCFFDVGNIVNYMPSDISEVTSPDEPRSVTSTGVWKRVLYNDWGPSLLAANVHWLQLRYSTALSPGKYKVTVNVRVRNFVNLFPIRFRVSGGSAATKLKREFPPADIHFASQGADPAITQDYLNQRPVSICLGSIEVFGNDPQKLYPVMLEIEESGMVIKRDMSFLFAYFERVDTVLLQEQIGWFLRRDPNIGLTRTTRSAFRELTTLKLAICDPSPDFAGSSSASSSSA